MWIALRKERTMLYYAIPKLDCDCSAEWTLSRRFQTGHVLVNEAETLEKFEPRMQVRDRELRKQ